MHKKKNSSGLLTFPNVERKVFKKEKKIVDVFKPTFIFMSFKCHHILVY